MTGIYAFLHWFPMWAMALILYFLCIGILFIMRDYFEKLPYNISVASQQGDLALIGCILIGVEIIKKQEALAPWMGEVFQIMLIILSIVVGIAYQSIVFASSKSWGTIADAYHNMVIAPVLVFSFGITLPAISLYGTLIEKMFVYAFFLIWIITLSFDLKTGRLQQSKWLAKHGILVPIKRVK